ncbi:hypothetical protein ABIA32_002740 [Streptacidiphilus sp. MAP12-20]|uniref:hypothetical protein n=1 Tax=Streptacidiphilus sp. MAP12-20 TaxID=3156299 RepID=UPI0035112CAE
MARAHGRTLASIWEDPDFLALTMAQQRLYLFLISQPNLNHAGLLPLTIKRWSSKAGDLTADELRSQLAALEAARFVLVDDDTEELLIRTFVRNDGVWKMPKVMGAMVSGAQEISSHQLRRALLDEMDRIPLNELSDVPGPKLPSPRQQIRDHIAVLRRTITPPEPTPPNPLRNPSAAPSDTPADPLVNPSGTLSEAPAEPSTHAHACASHAPSPAPAPTPSPTTKESAGAREPEPARCRPDGRHLIPDDFTLTDAMRRWAAATFPGLDPDYETQQFMSHHRAEGGRRRSWPDEWQKWMRRSAKYASDRANRQPPLLQVHHGGIPATAGGRPLPGTDTTVAGWLALANQLADTPQEKHA